MKYSTFKKSFIALWVQEIISYFLTVRTSLLHNFVVPVFKNLSGFIATETLSAMFQIRENTKVKEGQG